VTYKIGFDGVVTAELEKLLQSLEKGVNGMGTHAQASDTGSLIASRSTALSSSNRMSSPCGEKGGQDIVIVVVIAIVAGAAAGYVAGKLAAKPKTDGEKGGQD
jgi:hypothetical protein